MESLHIRWMVRRDVPHLSGFGGLLSPEEVVTAMRQRQTIGMVAECGNDILGYMTYGLHRDFITVLDFAVSPDVRRSGVGRVLCDKLVYKLCSHRRTFLAAPVPDDRLDALMFFRDRGFTAIGYDRAESLVQMVYAATEKDWERTGNGAPPVNRVGGLFAES